jgi:hypothetical protein
MAAQELNQTDMQSQEEVFAERQNFNDEQARELGYPSAEVLRLSDKLGQIAGKWRRTKDQALVHEYGKVLLTMILKGYDVNQLDIEDRLPKELMPDIPNSRVREAIVGALSVSTK